MKEDKKLKRKVRNSYLISTISIALVLFLLGSVGYLMLTVMQVARTLQESVPITVELKNSASAEQRESIKKLLVEEPLVLGISFLSKDEKAEDPDFRKMFESNFSEVIEENPLLDSFELKLSSEASNKISADAFIERISKIDGVDRVSYPAMMAERLHSTIAKIHLILFIFGGTLLIISLILLNNTIRLAIFSKRYVINTMKMVGATKWFIMSPFLWDSIMQGILAGFIASTLFITALYGLNETIPELTSIADIRQTGIVVGIMVGGGVLISLLFTLFSINKFVNMTSSKIDLY